jgi:hypothetical protein
MRTFRLAVAVIGILVVCASPLRLDLLAADPTAADAEAAVLGTWNGNILLDGADEPLDGGYIMIGRHGEEWHVTVGPDARTQYPCTRIVRTETGIRFEASLPGREETRLLVYDVNIDGARMTGTVTFVRHGLTAPARLTFAKQPGTLIAAAKP